MKKSEQNDPAWELLAAARRVEPSPFFSRNVVREVRNLQASGRDREGVIESILSFFRQPLLPVMAGSVAALAILAAVFVSNETTPTPNFGAADLGTPAAEFNPAREIEDINYLGELMTVSDPADLDDAALADLYLMASR